MSEELVEAIKSKGYRVMSLKPATNVCHIVPCYLAIAENFPVKKENTGQLKRKLNYVGVQVLWKWHITKKHPCFVICDLKAEEDFERNF
jgi:hypothetical protein